MTRGDTTKMLVNRTLANKNPTCARDCSIEHVTAAHMCEKPLFARVTHRVLGESDAYVEDARQKTNVHTYMPYARFPPALTSSSAIAIEICRITRDILNKLNPINRRFRVPIGNSFK